jgi:hypothetical protein
MKSSQLCNMLVHPSVTAVGKNVNLQIVVQGVYGKIVKSVRCFAYLTYESDGWVT